MSTRWTAADVAAAQARARARAKAKPKIKLGPWCLECGKQISGWGSYCAKHWPAGVPKTKPKITPATPPIDSQIPTVPSIGMGSGPQGAGGSAGPHTRAWQIDESGLGETIVKRKPSKYHAQPTGRYASQKEARRGAELRLMLAHGLITDLEEQRVFVLVPAQHDEHGKCLERAVTYKADFVYRHAGKLIVEDVKSPATRTEAYVIRRKLMLFVHKISVAEV